jgi:predicted transcriptional regulator
VLAVGGVTSPSKDEPPTRLSEPSVVDTDDSLPNVPPITGELQTQAMSAIWRLGSGTVEQVRAALPPRYRGAYNTIQTVLNRLAERGLLSRQKAGYAIEYRPRLSEADYLSRSISQILAGASMDARQAALAQLISGFDKDELADLQQLARKMSAKRRKR